MIWVGSYGQLSNNIHHVPPHQEQQRHSSSTGIYVHWTSTSTRVLCSEATKKTTDETGWYQSKRVWSCLWLLRNFL